MRTWPTVSIVPSNSDTRQYSRGSPWDYSFCLLVGDFTDVLTLTKREKKKGDGYLPVCVVFRICSRTPYTYPTVTPSLLVDVITLLYYL